MAKLDVPVSHIHGAELMTMADDIIVRWLKKNGLTREEALK